MAKAKKSLKKGAIIEDDLGQLKHPGKVTKINSPNITMKGVNFPVLGISDVGDSKIMLPEEDYKFDGSNVTEFPLNNLQNGGSVKDQLDDILLKTALLKERQHKRDSVRQVLTEKHIGEKSKVNEGMLNYYKTEPKEYLNLDPKLLSNKRKKNLLGTLKKNGGTVNAQFGAVIDSLGNLTTEQVTGAIGTVGNVMGAIGQIGQDKQRASDAERFYKLSKVVKQAASLPVEQAKRNYVRPEDFVIDPDQLAPTYGVGTNYLKKGGKIKHQNGGVTMDPSQQLGSVGGVLGSYLGGGTGDVSGASQLGGTIGGLAGSLLGPVGSIVGKGVGSLIGGIAGAGTQKKIKKYTDKGNKNLQYAALYEGTQGLRQQYGSFMEHGGEKPLMEKGGQLKTYWGGKTEVASENPYLPYDGQTVEFKGNSHKEGGIGIKYGNSPVEVEGGETAIKMKDGKSNSLVVFGDLKIPSYGISELNDSNAKGKNFKSYIKKLNEQENKQNSVVEKGVNLINDTPVIDSFDKLKVSSGKALIEGGNMKLKDIASKKQIAANIQNAILETAEEFGLKSDSLAKGKIEKAQKGKKIEGYQNGGNLPASVKRSEIDPFLNQGWTLEEAMNRLAKTTSTMGSSGTLPQAKGGPQAKEEEYWKNFLIPQLQKGISPDELVNKGYMSKSNAAKAAQYYKPISGTSNTQYIPITDEGIQKESYIPTTVGEGTPGGIPPASAPNKGKLDWMSILNAGLPYIRPSNQMPLDPNQLSGEMFALATNQLDTVQAQKYQPLLENVSDISLQDQLNANQADFNALTKLTAKNPAAQAQLAAQKYQANSSVLGEQFRLNQDKKTGVYNRNRGVLNDATLKNLAILDQQYVRQTQAKTATKAVAQSALSSIADKIARNKLENRTLGVYENLYNYRFDNKGRAYNMNPLAQFDFNNGPVTVDETGKVVLNERKVEKDQYGIVEEITETSKEQQKRQNRSNKKNGGLVKAMKGC